MVLHGRMEALSTPNFEIVASGQTFRAEPLSISTRATLISLHLTAMCKALLWPVPSGGNSSSDKEIPLETAKAP